LSGEGLGQAHALAGGLADVGVVQQPVDGRGGQCFGHEFVEGRGVKVGRNGDGTFLIGGIDEAVETLGGVGGHGQQPNVVDLCGYPHSSIYAEPATMPRTVVGVLLFGCVAGRSAPLGSCSCRHSCGLSAA